MRPLGAPVLLSRHDLASIPRVDWLYACSAVGTAKAVSTPHKDYVKQRYPLVFEERQAYYEAFTMDSRLAEVMTLREFLADAVFTEVDVEQPDSNNQFVYLWEDLPYFPRWPPTEEYEVFERRLATRNQALAGRTYTPESFRDLIDKDPDLYQSLVFNINTK